MCSLSSDRVAWPPCSVPAPHRHVFVIDVRLGGFVASIVWSVCAQQERGRSRSVNQEKKYRMQSPGGKGMNMTKEDIDRTSHSDASDGHRNCHHHLKLVRFSIHA